MKKTFIVLVAVAFVICFYSWGLAETCSGRVTMRFDLSGHGPDKPVRLWVPYPVSDNYQQISHVEVRGTFDHWAVYTDREFQAPMLYACWGPGAGKKVMVFSFDVTRKERVDKVVSQEAGCMDPSCYARYLRPACSGCASGRLADLAAGITAGKHTVRGKARAIYDWICDHMHRDPGVRGCGNGNVCVLLNLLGGKCVDISSVFVALARTCGIPAREVFGIRLGRDGTTDITGCQHCWAEFYLPGYGWVVVDPADVLKAMLKKGIRPENPEAMRLREYYWGAVDPYRVRLSWGRNLVLNPPQKGPRVNYLMYPFAQAGDVTLDPLDAENFKYTITYRRLD